MTHYSYGLAAMLLPDYRKVKASALKILQQFNITEPPVNPLDIARGLGVSVYFVELEKELKDTVSGFYAAKDDTIFVNQGEFPLRQTFTVAHELGHKILHAEWAKSSDYKVLMRDQAAESKNPIEQEANAFAAHLLVPRFMLDEFHSVASVKDLSKLFAVSVPVIENRIKFEYGT